MKMLYGAGNTLEDKKMMTPVVFSNTIAAMRILLDNAKNFGYDTEVRLLTHLSTTTSATTCLNRLCGRKQLARGPEACRCLSVADREP
jgi:hypothetical protein